MFSPSANDGAFSIPRGLAVDAVNDRRLVADSFSYNIQRFVLSTGAYYGSNGWTSSASGTCSSGVQSSWCTGGGPNFLFATTDGGFWSPTGLAIDVANDRFYVSDATTNNIQKFVLSTGAFIGAIDNAFVPAGTCISGTQNAWCAGGYFLTGTRDGQFDNNNGGIAADADAANNRLVVADGGRTQKFNLSVGSFIGSLGGVLKPFTTWTKTSIVGAAASTSNFDSGFHIPAGGYADKVHDRLYVSEADSYSIKKFVLSTGALIGAIGKSTASGTCIAGPQTSWCKGGTFSSGPSDGQFDGARSVAIDTVNNLIFVADRFNYRIQKYNSLTGAFLGALGNSAASGNCVAGVQKTWCTGGVFSPLNSDGGFSYPESIFLDGTYLYVAEYYQIHRIKP